MKFKRRTLDRIADMICGNYPDDERYFPYRTSSALTRFFQDADTDYEHDGSTRAIWVVSTLEDALAQPSTSSGKLSDSFLRIIRTLMDTSDLQTLDESKPGMPRVKALAALNTELKREGFEAFYAEDEQCYLKEISSGKFQGLSANPHRPLSKDELLRRTQLNNYLDGCSEDELISEILLPLFRQLGFHRITSAGHKDKALEYGKDIWMRHVLPTQHVLYFGIQVKKGKLDSAGMTKGGNANIAEIHNQCLMMLGHEIFDPELSRRVLVDHAYIVAGGEITKQARNWLGERLDMQQRSQIMFMEREDIVNLYIVNNVPLPVAAQPNTALDDDDLPF